MNFGQQKLNLKVENFNTNTVMPLNFDIPSDANYMLTSN